MGILNVTPDSFSDGGRALRSNVAVDLAMEMIQHGADLIDVGGESTRPDSHGVSVEEELSRVIPVIEGIRRNSNVVLSVDTTKPEVASRGISAGADIVNDVSMLRGAKTMATVIAETGAGLLLMHSRGNPETMQQYTDYPGGVVGTVISELSSAISIALEQGILRERICVDPGIGFAKTAQQNIELMAGLDRIVQMGYPVVVGPSRKSFIGALTGAPVNSRQGGTAAAVAWCVRKGAWAVRVHDVAMMKQVVQISAFLKSADRKTNA